MRLSRRGVLHSNKLVRWEKWSCTKESGTYYSQGSFVETDGSVIPSGTTYQGYSTYSFDSFSAAPYTNSGAYISIGYGKEGTIYTASGTTCTKRVVAYTGSTWYTTTYVAEAVPHSDYIYVKGSTSYGYVYAVRGAYPDASLYTYETNFSTDGVDYIVMRTGTPQDRVYYCYNQA
jgi:hypothetical protein